MNKRGYYTCIHAYIHTYIHTYLNRLGQLKLLHPPLDASFQFASFIAQVFAICRGLFF